MCGIAGIAILNGAPPDEAVLRRMTQALAHRGPDGEGIWSSPGVGLAHRRLSIIDVSSRAKQPMQDAGGRLTIVFNGEIYNYRELRQTLSASWKTESDTEVILEGYKKWGDDIVLHLRGMFAFALWDGERKRLLLARDRIGKKPLFYSTTPEGDLVFGSEIKSFQGLIPFDADWQAIRLFLGLQYVPSPRTGYENIKQLEPGMIGVWENGEFKMRKYHDWNVGAHGNAPSTEEEVDHEIRMRLEEAVKIRMLAADVPVGAFLSGGIDSAAVVAFASKYARGGLQTFTMGFSESRMDERKEARALADHFGTQHHAFEARPEDLLELGDTLVAHYDAPYADSSALPLWLLARETASHIKVVLAGDGGDEIFGGYRRYAAYEQALACPALTVSLFDLTGKVLSDARFSRMAEVVRTRSYGEMFCGSYFGTRDLARLCRPEFMEQTQENDAVGFVTRLIREGEETSPLRAAMHFDLVSYLPDDLNVKMDRATMAFGLEARAPFLDQELISFALGLPLKEKVKWGKTKIALKRALKGVVPDDVLRRFKRGFQVPLAAWFRGPLEPMLRERCLGAASPLRTIVRGEEVKRLIEENRHGVDHGNRLWMLLSLSTWLNQHAA